METWSSIDVLEPLQRLDDLGSARDGMVQQEPARAQQSVHLGEVGVVVVESDMLEHAQLPDPEAQEKAELRGRIEQLEAQVRALIEDRVPTRHS